MDYNSKLECCKKPGLANIQELAIEPSLNQDTTTQQPEVGYENTYIYADEGKLGAKSKYTVLFQSKHDLSEDLRENEIPKRKMQKRSHNLSAASIPEYNLMPGPSSNYMNKNVNSSEVPKTTYDENTFSKNNKEQIAACVYEQIPDNCNYGPDRELGDFDPFEDSDDESITTTSQ